MKINRHVWKKTSEGHETCTTCGAIRSSVKEGMHFRTYYIGRKTLKWTTNRPQCIAKRSKQLILLGENQ